MRREKQFLDGGSGLQNACDMKEEVSGWGYGEKRAGVGGWGGAKERAQVDQESHQ